MKARQLFLLISTLFSLQVTIAQTMSDSQVISYAAQRYATGADLMTIGTELLSKGATKDQLMRIYQSTGSGIDMPTTTTTITNQVKEDVDRSRVNNEEKAPAVTPEVKKTDGNKRVIFGHDIFRSEKLTFEPNMSLAVAPTYQLSAGDELIVDVYGASQATNKIQIAPDGTVTIPRIGPVAVAGLTVEQAQSKVRSALGMHYKNASIKVSVGQTRTISISVMGEVKTPGSYSLSAFATVFHALYMAGGVNDIGTLRDIKVARNGKIISTVDIYEYILNGRLAGSIRLKDNDVIIVGSYDNLVQITGNVKRPMWYEMKKNESVQSLLRFCGGFTGDAFTKNIFVNRRAGSGLSVYTVDEFDFASFKLADEDSVFVQANEQRYSNIVSISGAVKRPGQYQVTAVNTIKGLVETAGGLEENAMTSRGVIIRMNTDRTRKTISFDLEGIMSGNVPDISLQNEDSIAIASLADINDNRTMTIEGEVYKPGTFTYSANTTIEDLVVMSGGLKESASLLNVEVARRIIDSSAPTDSTTRCQTFTLSMADGLKMSNGSKFELQPYDKVYIRRSPIYQEQSTVNVSGEVVFAGNYTLKNNEVHISEILKNAGGVKKNACAHNARLIRKMDDTELARAKQLYTLAKTTNDSITTDGNKIYTLAIDLEKAIAQPGSKYDVLLRDGDQIIVPQKLNTVKISGEVLYPNNVTYIEGKNYKYYINEAGGYTKHSLRRRAYIVYANGHVSRASRGKIEPGCEVVVPVKDKKQYASDGTKWITVGASVMTAGAVLLNALK